jgi:ubiquitin carboxyl-terminal hydrolase L3
VFHRARDKEVAEMSEYTGTGEMPVMWFRQTIREACGMMALLHCLCNGPARHYIQPGSLLDNLRKQSIPLAPTERAAVLYNSQELEEAHMAAAQLGDTSTPAQGYIASHHFIAFVKGDDGHLWELNGGIKGPVDRGILGPEDDAISETALRLGVRTLIDKGEGDPSFSIVALSLHQ